MSVTETLPASSGPYASSIKDDDVNRPIERDNGILPPIALEAFGDVEDNVRQSTARLEASCLITKKSSVRGSSTTFAPGVPAR